MPLSGTLIGAVLLVELAGLGTEWINSSTEQLVLTALNLTKSAYVSFTFAANRFFSRFHFEGNAQYRERFFCSIYIKARPLPPLLCQATTHTNLRPRPSSRSFATAQVVIPPEIERTSPQLKGAT